MRLNFVKLIIVIALVSMSNQWGIFSAVKNAVNTAVSTVVNTAKAVVQAVQTIKDNAYAFLSPDNIFVKGKCTFQGRSWDCTVTASNNYGLDVTGGIGNVNPEYRFGQNIKIPYSYITGVTTSNRQYTVAFVRFTERTYYVAIDRLGVKDTLVIDQDHPDSVNRFIDNINSFRSVRRNILNTAKSSILTVASVYNTQAQFISQSRESYSNNLVSIASVNTQISNVTNELAKRNAEKGSLEVVNNGLNKALTDLLQIREQKQRIVNICDSEIVATSTLLTTYVKYKEEFTDDKASDYLDKEFSNLCQFHLATQDISLIIPSEVVPINKLRKDVTEKRNIDAVDDFFNKKEFFILKDK